MLTLADFSDLYPNLALFTKEKGWRCGKSFISWRSRCYTNPNTGRKLGFKYEINPKTGRKRKVRIGLTYKEYQKARSKAVKKRGQGKRLSRLEEKYIADTQRLATSTRRKKQRRLDARNKRKGIKGDASVTIPSNLFKKDKQKKDALSNKLQELENQGIPAFTEQGLSSSDDGKRIIALNKDGTGTIYYLGTESKRRRVSEKIIVSDEVPAYKKSGTIYSKDTIDTIKKGFRDNKSVREVTATNSLSLSELSKSRVVLPKGYSVPENQQKALTDKLQELDSKGLRAYTVDSDSDIRRIYAFRDKDQKMQAYRYQGEKGYQLDKGYMAGKSFISSRSWSDRNYDDSGNLSAANEAQVKYWKQKKDDQAKAYKEAARQRELKEATRKAEDLKRSKFSDYLESAAKSLKGKKGEIEAPVSVRINEQSTKREIKNLKTEATLYGANGEFAYHPSFSKTEAAAGVKVLTHVKTGAQIYKPRSQKEARQVVYQILNSDANLDVDDPKKFTPQDLSEISKALYSVQHLKVPDDFDLDNPPEIRNFNPQKKRRRVSTY